MSVATISGDTSQIQRNGIAGGTPKTKPRRAAGCGC